MPCGHDILSVARIPVPPPRLIGMATIMNHRGESKVLGGGYYFAAAANRALTASQFTLLSTAWMYAFRSDP